MIKCSGHDLQKDVGHRMSRITLSDRTSIEIGIYGKKSLNEIAKSIGKTVKAVSREIRTNCTRLSGAKPRGNDCRYALNCRITRLCGREQCNRKCVSCYYQVDCRPLCKHYDNEPCAKLSRPPYVCNTCAEKRTCRLDRMYYNAAQADAAAHGRYSKSRRKPHLNDEEMTSLDRLVSPLIRKGQPISHIFAEHGDDIPVTSRTLYNYIDAGHLSVGNLDLRRKVGYRTRKKKGYAISEAYQNREHRKTRTIEDFARYMERHPETPYVEMDTVKGVREKGKRMLTLIFTEQNLMLMLIMPDGTADSVLHVFDWLTDILGLETFRALFPVILTDNGSEFMHTDQLEHTMDGKRRTRLFYCDPMASWQKPHVEKNHEYIRYVLPKGRSFSAYTQEDFTVLMNHINSTKRDKLGGKSPYEMARSSAYRKLMSALGLHQIPPDEILLTPRLMRWRDGGIST